GEDDNPRSFYHQDHFNAQIIWFKHGYLIYHFGILAEVRRIKILWLELSFEVCSEAPMYRDPWKSDISVTINGYRIGTWTSPADFGGRRGILNPGWWSDLSTQYGMLKTWRVDATGTYVDKAPVSGVTIDQLDLIKHNSIVVGIGVPPDAENVGGINLFGKEFGDFSQGIVLKVGYRIVDETHEPGQSDL
ncbi:MAG: transcriptional regulator, partial [Eubacteriales bacterium]|nr:transcriptional regulator [Eubacteriales bacterium]